MDLGWLNSISASERHNSFLSRRDIFDHFLGPLAARRKGACPRRHRERANDIRPLQVPKALLNYLRSKVRIDQPRRQLGPCIALLLVDTHSGDYQEHEHELKVNLCREVISWPPKTLTRSPPFTAGGAVTRPNNGRVDHLHGLASGSSTRESRRGAIAAVPFLRYHISPHSLDAVGIRLRAQQRVQPSGDIGLDAAGPGRVAGDRHGLGQIAHRLRRFQVASIDAPAKAS